MGQTNSLGSTPTLVDIDTVRIDPSYAGARVELERNGLIVAANGDCGDWLDTGIYNKEPSKTQRQ
jgi:hypothetical protein